MTNGTTSDSHLQSWFSSLLENTQDLNIWLVYADWLEDHGYPQAEVTRLWAMQRWESEQWSAQQEQRLDTLLKEGLRPCLPRHVNSLGMSLVLIPRGTFLMSDNERNLRNEVTLDYDFYMGIYPVTQGQWQTLMGPNPSYYSRNGDGSQSVSNIPNDDLQNFPVERVSRQDAQLFLQQLNAKENVGSPWHYRLPTAAEWEYACREASISEADCAFDFYGVNRTNAVLPMQANTADAGPYRTTKVDAYPPNRLGIYDMHGNVWEWCAGQQKFPEIRGGSWRNLGRYCRAASRHGRRDNERLNVLGFRIVRVPTGK